MSIMPGFQGWDADQNHPYAAKFKTRIHVPTTTSTAQLYTGFGTILFLIMEETTGSAAARFELWDGAGTSGEYIGPWTLASGQSFDNAYPSHGIPFRSGIYLNVTSGSVAGSIVIGTLVPWPRVHGGED